MPSAVWSVLFQASSGGLILLVTCWVSQSISQNPCHPPTLTSRERVEPSSLVVKAIGRTPPVNGFAYTE